MLKPRRCGDCPKIQDFIHTPPRLPDYHPPSQAFHLLCQSNCLGTPRIKHWLLKTLLSWKMMSLPCEDRVFLCHKFHVVLSWESLEVAFLKYCAAGWIWWSVPSLSWRFANILMEFVNLCISLVCRPSRNSKQVARWPSLYISIQEGKGKGACIMMKDKTNNCIMEPRHNNQNFFMRLKKLWKKRRPRLSTTTPKEIQEEDQLWPCCSSILTNS